MSQLSLTLERYGQQAVALIPPDMQRRLRTQLMSRDHFYVMGSKPDSLMTWLGKGQPPRWIKDWLSAGNRLADLACPTSQLTATRS